MSNLISFCKDTAESPRFQGLIVGLIVMTAVVMGLETSPFLVDYYSTWFDVFFFVVQVIFCTEIAVRILAHAPNIGAFFKTGWNRFDFLVVLISVLPASGPFALIARLLRIFRVARLVSASHHLRSFVGKLADSLDITLQALMVAFIFYYIYTIGGYHIFAFHDESHWGSFDLAFITLLKLATFQGLPEIMHGMGNGPLAWLFVGSFILINIALFVNFIAATTIDHLYDQNSRISNDSKQDLATRLADIETQIAALRQEVLREQK